jgi:hypothetical protein
LVLLIVPNYFTNGQGGHKTNPDDHLLATLLITQNIRLHKEVSAGRLQLRKNYAQGEASAEIVKQVNRRKGCGSSKVRKVLAIAS